MEKSRIWVLVLLILALFFLCSMDAEAADYSAYHRWTVLANEQIPSGTKSYTFFIGSDGLIHLSDSYNNSYPFDNVYQYASGTEIITFDTGDLGTVVFTEQENEGLRAYDSYDYFGSLIYSHYTNSVSFLSYGSASQVDSSVSVLTFKPYVIINGEKHYLSDSFAFIEIGEPYIEHSMTMGAEVQLKIDVSGFYENFSDLLLDFGKCTFTVNWTEFNLFISGCKYISTGENEINKSLNSIEDILSTFQSGYDSTTGESANSSLSGSLDSWEAAEGETMSDAKIDVSNYDVSSVFSFAPALVSSLTLVTAFTTGYLYASGDFLTAISVMFSLVFVSVLVGLVRFVRR